VWHAPTAANASGVFQCQFDVPAEPIEDPVRHAIRASGPRTMYTSPMLRARTAADLLFPGEPVIADNRLMEHSMRAWKGLDHATVRQRWPEYGEDTTGLMLTPPGGESLDAFAGRVKRFRLSLAGCVMDTYVVTHNGWIRVALMLNGEITPDRLFAEQVPFLAPIP
jgi:broad specificity phosphatase PhoE